jgi:hypothetical protein
MSYVILSGLVISAMKKKKEKVMRGLRPMMMIIAIQKKR